MALRNGTTLASCSTQRDDVWNSSLEPKHKVFLSHSGAQKAFVEHLCMELEGRFVFPFFDKRHESLPIGENFPGHIFAAIQQCHVGVVILSEGFFMSKWPMMELVAMVEEVEKRKSSFKIIPVFFGTSLKEFDDPITRTRWQLCWQELSLNTNRVEVEKWEASVKHLRGINGLIYDGLDEVRFQRMVVDAICEVPVEIRLEDSYIQGRSRICKEIRDKIDELQKAMIDKVCVMGLYGMGGIGKTSICKALCNDFHMTFRGKVCHAELERVSEEELLRDVVKRLSNASHERMDRFNRDELESALKGGVIKEAIFLALDNMSDSDTSITEVKTYLTARLPPGSIVVVTTRSKASLTCVRPFISEENCMEMPEIEIEEAKSLFTKSSSFMVENEDDVQLMQRCVERCRFLKGGVVKQYHYHPLALDVLGRQLGYIDPSEWNAQLDKIDEDIFNQSKENDHRIFSILRKSFDALPPKDQVLFMDVALYLPYGLTREKSISMQFEWLGIVHGMKSIEDVLVALQRLKRKSLLEEVGDGKTMRSGMHDLWHAFCIAEMNYGKKKWRRWVYEGDGYRSGGQSACHSDLVEINNICWKNVRRMAFVRCERKIVKGVNFVHFQNITVLKVMDIGHEGELVIDLLGLCLLRSLEVVMPHEKRVIVHNLPKGLIFLKGDRRIILSGGKSVFDTEESMNGIECMEELQYLDLSSHIGGKLPDMKNLFSLSVARLDHCNNVVTLTGLGLQLGRLRVLDLIQCWELRSCPGVGDLENLEELNCFGCKKLERLPNLQKLAKLRKLDISKCKNIKELPGLNDLVALEELRAISCSQLQKLPAMHKLKKLRILDLSGCPQDALLDFNSLSSLEEVAISFYNEEDKPSLRHLTKVQRLVMEGWSLRGLRDVPSLVMLEKLVIHTCCGVEELPDLRSLVRLQSLEIRNCDFKDVSNLENLRVLNRLRICECEELERLPNLRRLTRLEWLLIEKCPMVQGWGCTLGIDEGPLCLMDDTSNQLVGPDYGRVTNLHQMTLKHCGLVDLTGIGAFSKLEALVIESLPAKELPDLSVFPCLKSVRLSKCESLRGLESCSPVAALLTLRIGDCMSLAMMPDLCQFPWLQELELSGCPGIPLLSCSGPLHALYYFIIKDCSGLKELPDMGMFPVLRIATVKDMNALTGLRCSGPLTALQGLEVNDCSGLQEMPDLRLFPAMDGMTLKRVGSLPTWSSIGPVPTSGEVEGSSVVFDQSDPPHSRRIGHFWVKLTDCGFADLRGIGALSRLSTLSISSLQVLEVADLSNFPRLQSLTLAQCERLTRVTSCEPMTRLQELEIRDCESLETVPDLSKCPELRLLDLKKCHRILSLSSTGTKLPALKVLSVEDFSTGLEEVLEWEMFPALERVYLTGYRGLKLLRNLEFLTGLIELKLSGWTNLATLPDLSAFPQLRWLKLSECHGMTSLSSTRPSTELTQFNIMDCCALQQLPDLWLFPALEKFTILRLRRLTTLSCNVPLSALKEVRVKECGGLSVEHLDQLRASAAPGCKLEYVPCDAAVVQVSPDSVTPRQATLVHEDAGCMSWLSSCLLQ